MRPDGRASGSTIRPLSCELSCLQNADGSALWKSGSTHVMAAVYGPIAPQQINREQADGAIVSILIKSGKSVNNNMNSSISGGAGSGNSGMETEWIAWLTKLLHCAIDTQQHPRTTIEIILQIIQDDGSVLGCLLHAAVAALMDAGIEMLYLPVATTCLVTVLGTASTESSQQQMLDPTLAEEEQDNTALVVIVNRGGGSKSSGDRATNPDQLLACHSIGSKTIPLNHMLSCIPLASHASPAVMEFWRLAVEQKVTRESQTLWSK